MWRATRRDSNARTYLTLSKHTSLFRIFSTRSYVLLFYYIAPSVHSIQVTCNYKSMAPSSTSGLSQDLDSEVFGPLTSIPTKSLIQLANRISGKSALGNASSEGQLVTKLVGSYNIVHIIQLGDVRLVIRVPATGWGKGMTPEAASALRSQVDTLRFIAENTTIPVPMIYGFDTSTDNEIGAPYICMSFIPGRTVASCWFDDRLEKQQLEDFRLHILTGLAEISAQFSPFSFDKIGSLFRAKDALSNNGLVIGPCYDWLENDDGSLNVVASGPFDTLEDYLENKVSHRSVDQDGAGNVWTRASDKMLDVVLPCLLSHNTNESFVLSVPDFDSQNVMVDDEGTTTGILDWDLMQTMPRIVGYARYPSWITRDWDPLMYGWPKNTKTENSPDELQRYRNNYNHSLGVALNWRGGWRFSASSHITEAIWVALLQPPNRLEIFRKLVSEVSNGANGEDALEILYSLGSGELSKEQWSELKRDLSQLVGQKL